MQPTNHEYTALLQEVEHLANEQAALQQQLAVIRTKLTMLQQPAGAGRPGKIIYEVPKEEASPVATPVPSEPAVPHVTPPQAPAMHTPSPANYAEQPSMFSKKPAKTGLDFEKFIGENLISKIGILITVIGVGIGTKYAIDNQMLSPLARIILGYLLGLGLLVFALSLKAKYESFSAVLISGAMAIFYLITFAAYDFYQIIQQGVAFGMMVLFTAFTVTAALHYNRQWIALLGLAGAYGVPFLLSNGSGNVTVLFSYMSLLNVGILAVAVKRYWRLLYYTSFGISWLIFWVWFIMDYRSETHFALGLIFATVFFAIFYAVFLVNKLIERKPFEPLDVVMLLFHSFIYYGIGFAMINDNPNTERFTGLFTLGNAIVHFAIASVIYRIKLADRNLFYLVAGLVLVFITLAVPVQLDGTWVTLIWAAEAALLFWIGTTQKVRFYLVLSFPLMVLAFLSQIHDWDGMQLPSYGYYAESATTPIFNVAFAVAMLVVAAFGFITYLGQKAQEMSTTPSTASKPITFFFSRIFAAFAMLFILYFALRAQLIHFWHIRYGSRQWVDPEYPYYSFAYNAPVLLLLKVWILNYSNLFMAGLLCIGAWKVKTKGWSIAPIIISLLLLLFYWVQGLPLLGDLRDANLNPDPAQAQVSANTTFIIRYVSYACAGLLLFGLYLVRSRIFTGVPKAGIVFDAALHITLLCIGSSELITWLKLGQSAQFDKLGLSIFWGIYSLMLIGLGIFTKKQHLRIGAIALLGITLVKLFFYDIAHLNTMAKTIVFVSLGLLLLFISFLYNKYKTSIGSTHES